MRLVDTSETRWTIAATSWLASIFAVRPLSRSGSALKQHILGMQASSSVAVRELVREIIAKFIGYSNSRESPNFSTIWCELTDRDSA